MEDKRISKGDYKRNSKLAIVCYIFAPIAYFSKARKKSNLVRFHAHQGMNLFLYELLFTACLVLSIIFLKEPKICVDDKTKIAIECGKVLPKEVIIILVLIFVIILYSVFTGIKNVITQQETNIPLVNNKNNLFK